MLEDDLNDSALCSDSPAQSAAQRDTPASSSSVRSNTAANLIAAIERSAEQVDQRAAAGRILSANAASESRPRVALGKQRADKDEAPPLADSDQVDVAVRLDLEGYSEREDGAPAGSGTTSRQPAQRRRNDSNIETVVWQGFSVDGRRVLTLTVSDDDGTAPAFAAAPAAAQSAGGIGGLVSSVLSPFRSTSGATEVQEIHAHPKYADRVHLPGGRDEWDVARDSTIPAAGIIQTMQGLASRVIPQGLKRTLSDARKQSEAGVEALNRQLSDQQSEAASTTHRSHGGAIAEDEDEELQEVVGGEEMTLVGPVFEPDVVNNEENGKFQRRLPENVYAAAILTFLTADSLSKGLFRSVIVVGPPVLFTMVAQVSLALFLGVSVTYVDGDLAGVCKADLFYLQSVALIAFISLAMRDLITVVEMHQWLQMFPRTKTFIELALQRYRDKEGNCVHRPVSGITLTARFFIYLLLIVPYFFVTVLTLFVGSGAVLRSANRFDLVLNCVAAVFVLELDDIGYALLIARSFKNTSEGLPPLNRGQSEGTRFKRFGRTCCTFFYSWFVLGFIMGLSYPIYQAWCTWDVDYYYRKWSSEQGWDGDIEDRFDTNLHFSYGGKSDEYAYTYDHAAANATAYG